MRVQRLSWYVSCLFVLLAASGCFQPAGSGLEATAIGQAVPTFTLPPTETPVLPTEAPTDTPEPATATPDAPIVEPTLTDTPSPTLDLGLATLTPTLAGGTEIAFAPIEQEGVDPFALTATALLQAQLQPTQTPFIDNGGGGEFPDQGIIDPLQQGDPLALTATAVILNSTLTAEAPMTQTAQAILFPTATQTTPFVGAPTPTLTPPVGGGIPGTDCVHEVRRGDNLFRISLFYGLPLADIAGRNGITNVNFLLVGQRLTIPGCGTTGNVPGPTSTPPAGGDQPGGGIPGTGGQVYVVRQYDTLFQISLRYGVPIADIAARNGIGNINLIYIGQELVIP